MLESSSDITKTHRRPPVAVHTTTLANVPALDPHICASNAKTYTMRIHDTKRDFPLSCAASLTRKNSQKKLDNIRQSVQRGLSQQQMLPASHHRINITRSSSWHGKNSSASPKTQVNWHQQKNQRGQCVCCRPPPEVVVPQAAWYRLHDCQPKPQDCSSSSITQCLCYCTTSTDRGRDRVHTKQKGTRASFYCQTLAMYLQLRHVNDHKTPEFAP